MQDSPESRDETSAADEGLVAPFPQPIVDRFWAKVNKTDGCWLWSASLRHKGYGAFCYRLNGRTVHDRAHRFSWCLHRGLIPPGRCVLHRCDTPACVNPDHLFLGTISDNHRDMCAKGRHGRPGPGGNYPRGEAHHHARLTEAAVRAVRLARSEGCSYSQLAGRFGISPSHAYRLCSGKSWTHVR